MTHKRFAPWNQLTIWLDRIDSGTRKFRNHRKIGPASPTPDPAASFNLRRTSTHGDRILAWIDAWILAWILSADVAALLFPGGKSARNSIFPHRGFNVRIMRRHLRQRSNASIALP